MNEVTPSSKRSFNKRTRAVLRGAAGLAVLIGFAYVGGEIRSVCHSTLPGPVIGLALLAAIHLLARRIHLRSHRHMRLHLAPVSRLLISHMGLLFVPAGLGIIAEGDELARGWLAIFAGLIASTLLGLVATGWLMHRFGTKGAKA